jgi:dihydroorotate dehydrogenase electron transfer subunit
MKQTLASVIYNNEVMPRSHLIWLESPQVATIARPGQFVMVHCGTETILRRPLSIHQVDGSKIALLFEVIGRGTAWLSQCMAGDYVDIVGPLGNDYTIYPDSQNLLLVAGGIGIAPLCFLAQEALSQGLTVTLLYGAHSEDQLYPTNLLPADINLVTATEIGAKDKKGMMVTGLLSEFVGQADQIFACGPLPMYRDMARRKQELKGKPVQISLEVRMGCGVGACYGCTVRTKSGLRKVCKDGPVFDLDDVLWDELADT